MQAWREFIMNLLAFFVQQPGRRRLCSLRRLLTYLSYSIKPTG